MQSKSLNVEYADFGGGGGGGGGMFGICKTDKQNNRHFYTFVVLHSFCLYGIKQPSLKNQLF